jgi:hypothetical protein
MAFVISAAANLFTRVKSASYIGLFARNTPASSGSAIRGHKLGARPAGQRQKRGVARDDDHLNHFIRWCHLRIHRTAYNLG